MALVWLLLIQQSWIEVATSCVQRRLFDLIFFGLNAFANVRMHLRNAASLWVKVVSLRMAVGEGMRRRPPLPSCVLVQGTTAAPRPEPRESSWVSYLVTS